MTAPSNANTSGLEACPFCGGEAWLNAYEAKYSDLPPKSRCPQCRLCGASMGYLPTPAKAVEAWNRRAAPASPLPGGGWQDISTAPALTDHMKPVLLFWKSSGVHLGYYDIDDDYRNRPKWWVSPATGWRCFGDQCIPVNQQDCTHWMPLPAAPTGEPK